ncbi:putative signaling protein [Escherichia coli]|uniref:diguanylate cyclase n=1 Tax=Escherichia coli TaxID=562 RepID=A0A2X1KWC5_ECOLX|nr:putative signaling protein [Escherichia coli]
MTSINSKNINDTFGHLLGDEVLMKVVKILKSQIPVDKGKVYRFGGDEFAVIYTGGTLERVAIDSKRNRSFPRWEALI